MDNIKTHHSIPENIIRRDRLLSLLNENVDKSLILLCYPAGSGKTTLIRNFLTVNNFNHAWVNVSDDINNCYDFLNSIVESLRKINPRFGNSTIQVIESLKQSISSEYLSNLNNVITTAAGTFINDFCSAFNEDIFLVLDDFHNIPLAPFKGGEGGWLELTMDFLFANIPSNMHIIISSRQIPEFNLSYLNAKRKMFQPGHEELNFTNDETKELLEKIYSIKYSEEEITALQSRELGINGWVTGIHLVAQASGQHGIAASLRAQITVQEKGIASPHSRGQLRSSQIFEFFAEEIFEKLDSGVKNFLIETALLQSFDDKLCDEILNIDNSKEIISGLIRKNIFIETLGDSYRYHALFKNFLLSKLYEAKAENEIQISVEQICEYFLKNNDTVSAINYLLIGKQFNRAVEMILKIGMKLMEENSYESLVKWLDLIPEDIMSENPYLLYFKARLSKYFISDLPSSIELYSKAIKLCEKLNYEDLLLDCLLAKAGAFSSLGKVEESLSILKPLQKMKLEPAYNIKMLYHLAFAYYRNTQYLQSIELLNELLEISKNENVKYLPEQSLNLIGLNYYGMGEFQKSELYFERVIDAAANIFLKFRAITYLEILYSNSGKYKKARELSNTTKSLGQFPGTFLELDSFMGELNLNFDTGDYESTIRTCEKIISLSDKLGYPDSKKFAYLFIARSYYYLNKWDLSKTNYDAGSSFLKKDDPWSINFDVGNAVLAKRTKSIPFAELEKTFLEQYKFCESKNYGIDKCEVGFHLADIYLNNGILESAEKYLQDALDAARDKQYVSFLERELLDSRALFDFALTENINKEFVKSIFENVLSKLSYDFLSDENRVRISGQIDGLYDISMSSFGELAFNIRGKPVPGEKWIGKKSKLLLAYLMVNQGNLICEQSRRSRDYEAIPWGIKLTKDKIIDALFPDLSSESVDQVFHNAISNLRNAISAPDISGKLSPGPVIYEHKELKLNPDCCYRIDTLLFDEYYNSVFSSDSTAEDKISACKKAIELYKGNFLDGFNEPWCVELRENYRSKFLKLS